MEQFFSNFIMTDDFNFQITQWWTPQNISRYCQPKSQVGTISNAFHFSSEHISTEHLWFFQFWIFGFVIPKTIFHQNAVCSHFCSCVCHHFTHYWSFPFLPNTFTPVFTSTTTFTSIKNLQLKYQFVDNDQNVSFKCSNFIRQESYRTNHSCWIIICITTIWFSSSYSLPNHYLAC